MSASLSNRLLSKAYEGTYWLIIVPEKKCTNIKSNLNDNLH